eukprot:SAG31_NODE_3549_length_4134_cov_3.066171_6_plen_122_part_00
MKWKLASFSQYERLGETIMGYTARTNGFRYTEWVTFNASTNDAKEETQRGLVADARTVGVELYMHDDSVNPVTGGLAKGCDWAMEGENLAHQAAYKGKVAELAQLLRKGWRGALPPEHEAN